MQSTWLCKACSAPGRKRRNEEEDIISSPKEKIDSILREGSWERGLHTSPVMST
jgi:hypothetical protein